MKSSVVLNGILIGLIIVLAGVILFQDSNANVARAQADGAPAMAGGIIAVTAAYSGDQSVLYLIDTNREIILTYACYTKSGGARAGLFAAPHLSFLNGRNYKFDAEYTERKGFFGRFDGPAPQQVREQMAQ